MTALDFTACGAHVTGFLHDDHERLVSHKIRPALVVCPGGGYNHLSPREGEAPAMAFFAQGYQVFLLEYALLEAAADCRPLRQLAQTLCRIRENAKAWHIDPEKIAVMGFSAGGHLAATLGARWDDAALQLPQNAKPNALVLCYPVITMGEFTHTGTRELVTGGDAAKRDWFSVENHVTAAFPPTFVWHTADDPSVPVENTLFLVRALRAQRIFFACHIFSHGEHGLSVCSHEVESPNPECSSWLPMSQHWLNGLFAFLP